MASLQKFTALEKQNAALAADLKMAFVRSLIRRGEIELEGKTAEELLAEIRRLFRRVTKNANFEATFTTDHTDELFEEASRYARKGDSVRSCVFLATWTEHFLNQLVESISYRDPRYGSCVGILIRDMGLRAKFIWVHMQFGIPVSELNLQRLNAVSEVRNYFIHYKWQAEDDALAARQKKARRAGVLLVKYLRKIEEEHVLANATPELSRLREIFRVGTLLDGSFSRELAQAMAEKRKSEAAK